MPPVVGPQSQWVMQMLQKHENLINQLASQQQNTISNQQGQPVINEGLVPGSNPPAYGFQLVDPSTLQPIGFFGVDSAGVAALQFFNSAGNVVTQFDMTGQTVYNASGVEEVHLGLLPGGAYGVAVLPAGATSGALQRVGGFTGQQGASLLNTSVTSWTTPTGASALSVPIGPSGLAQVAVSGEIATGAANQEASVGVSVNGGTPVSFIGTSVGAAGGILLITSTSFELSSTTGVVANAINTFELGVITVNNGSSTVNFSGLAISIQPL